MRTQRRSTERNTERNTEKCTETEGRAALGVSVPLSVLLLCVLCSLSVLAAQQPPPQPFPRPGAAQPARPSEPPPSTAPARPDIMGQPEKAPTEEFLGVPVYPSAQFIASYDAGRNQRYYIYGAAATFVDLVNWYRIALKQRGELVYEIPATHSFDVGRY